MDDSFKLFKFQCQKNSCNTNLSQIYQECQKLSAKNKELSLRNEDLEREIQSLRQNQPMEEAKFLDSAQQRYEHTYQSFKKDWLSRMFYLHKVQNWKKPSSLNQPQNSEFDFGDQEEVTIENLPKIIPQIFSPEMKKAEFISGDMNNVQELNQEIKKLH